MKLLSRFNIRSRIIVLAVLPFLAIALLAFNQYKAASSEQQSLANLKILMELAKESGELFNEVQLERDLSNGFLARENNIIGPKGDYFGENGNDFEDQLKSQRRIVDQQVNQYKAFVQSYQSNFLAMEGVNEAVDEIMQGIENLTEIRPKIDQYIMRDGKTWLTGTLDNITERFFRVFEAIVRLASDNRELSLMSNAYAALVTLSDKYSLERAVYTRATYNKTIAYNLYARGKTLRQEVVNAISRFNSFADRDLRTRFRTEFLDSDAMKTANDNWIVFRSSAGKPLKLEAVKFYQEASDNLNQLNGFKQSLANDIVEEADTLYQDATYRVWESLFVLFGGGLIIGGVSFLIIVSIVKPLKNLVKDLSHVAENKDLSYQVEITSEDELADVAKAFKLLLSNFNATLLGVRNVEKKMNQLTAQMLDSMASSKQRAENQNNSTDSVSVAMNQMAASIEQVSKSANDTSSAVSRLYDMSSKSSESANQGKNIMEQLTDELGTATGLVENVNRESNSIGEVLNVIQGIAEQTNLLALNAAIEAARAGEQGRGFAVVADEVRSLASRTQESTEHIKTQIDALQKGAETVTTSMEQLKSQGNEAVEVVIESLNAVSALHAELDNISQMSTYIATAAEQQNHVASDINQQIHEIKQDSDDMTQQVQSTMEASHELNNTAEVLNDHVEEFTVS